MRRAEPAPGASRSTRRSYVPFMQHSRRRDLREQLYRAFVTRASTGEHDNTPLLGRILGLRREQAAPARLRQLRRAEPGHQDGARRPGGASSSWRSCATASFDAAVRDLDELRALAREAASPRPASSRTGTLRSGPSACARSATRTATRRCARTSRSRACSTGLFALAERLFGVRVRAADGEAPVWHPDVRFFRIEDAERQPLAAFYLDPYSRPAEKRGGAWMDECVGRRARAARSRSRTWSATRRRRSATGRRA